MKRFCTFFAWVVLSAVSAAAISACSDMNSGSASGGTTSSGSGY